MYQLTNQPIYSDHKDTTQVTIKQDSPYRYIEEELTGNVTALSDEEIVKLVLDKLVAEVAPSHAINKLDERTTLLDEKVAEVDSFMTTAKETMGAIEKQSAVTQGALLEMIEIVGSLQIELQAALAEKSEEPQENEVKDENVPEESADETKVEMEGGEINDGNVDRN
ncbi:hypothetical protein [Hutsoniella sourekii]|uniref:hypothetical protein n=1 Tax=Hutsoniella sourekii TaxID=87650 RepID=UPI00048210AA|nr:hypothetical protein [Hutsoniella sourekii]